ncbi:hypothetical protein OH807_10325 [Kitasatospora sp. NBC_01560]|uniref:hypothetical protein n=1 Tax=Kitasatospora sp. NBC_01560 TaxID=2975965 RepID=UPI0038702204
MAAELVQQVVTTGATTVVGLMATEAWTQVRSRLAVLFGRGRDTEQVAAELEGIRVEVVRADGDAEPVGDHTAELRGRIRRLVRQDPGAAAELQAILAEFGPQQPAGAQVSITTNTFSDGTASGILVMAYNSVVHQHEAAPAPLPRSTPPRD